MPVMARVPLLVKSIFPLVALVASKLATVLAAFKVVPPTELVIKRAPLKKPAPVSAIVPEAVNERLPELVMLPELKERLRPAVADIAPEVLAILAFTKISLLPPVATKVTVPEPPAVMLLPSVCVPLELKLIVPLAAVLKAPLSVSAPELSIMMLPVFCVMPVIVKGAALLVNSIFPEPVLVALKLRIVLAALRVVPPTEEVIKEDPERIPPCPMVLPDVKVATPVKVRAGILMAAVV